MSSEPVCFTVSLPPSVNSMYKSWRGRMVLSEEAKTWKTIVHLEARNYFSQPLNGKIAVVYDFYFADNTSDMDNRLKALNDALQGSAFHNDKQIVTMTCNKFIDKHNPRVEVVLWQK